LRARRQVSDRVSNDPNFGSPKSLKIFLSLILSNLRTAEEEEDCASFAPHRI
jgi:hypothetical protein